MVLPPPGRQFCWSGDHTLEATQQAIAEAAAAPSDEEQFVFVVSDANLQRYGIPPQALGTLPCLRAPVALLPLLGTTLQAGRRSLARLTLPSVPRCAVWYAGKLLTSNPKVKAFAIFIASLSDEATRLSAAMPPGRGFVCMDTAQLPALFRSIFTTQFAGGK